MWGTRVRNIVGVIVLLWVFVALGIWAYASPFWDKGVNTEVVTVSFQGTLVWISGDDVGFDGRAILYFKEDVPLSRPYDSVFGDKWYGITVANMDGWGAAFTLVELAVYDWEFQVDASSIKYDPVLVKATLVEADAFP